MKVIVITVDRYAATSSALARLDEANSLEEAIIEVMVEEGIVEDEQEYDDMVREIDPTRGFTDSTNSMYTIDFEETTYIAVKV